MIDKKRYVLLPVLLLLMLWPVQLVTAQNSMTVESFRPLENDLAAITNGTMEFDQNGNVAALIKIVVTGTGFTFDVGSLGVVKTRQMGGEWWVYVPRGVQRITINHPQYGVLRNYYFDIPIEGARTYEMVLNPGVGKFMNIVSGLSGSYITMDGDTIGQSPITQYYMVYGEHKLTASREKMYGEVTVHVTPESEPAVSIDMQDMSYLYRRVRFNVADNAEIWFNGVRQGTGSWTTELKAGQYVIETRRFNCSNASTVVDVTTDGDVIFSLNAPEPYNGYLMLHVSQPNVVIVDQTADLALHQGQLEKLRVGMHTVTFTRKGYLDVEKEYDIQRDEVTMDTVRLEHYPFIKKNQFYIGGGATISQMPSASVIVGVTLYNVDLELSYGMGLTSTNTISWYKEADNSFYSKMNYKENRMGVRLGYQVKLSSRLSVTPQVGMSVATLSSNCVEGTGLLGNGASATMLTVGGKLFFFPGKHMALFLRPEYCTVNGTHETYSLVTEKCGLDTGGFAATAGFTVNF